MTPQRLREMVDAATPGPWTYEVREGDEWWFGSGNEVVEIRPVTGERWNSVAVMGTRRSASPDAGLIALSPQLARLCAEQHEWLSHNAPEDHHPTCAIALPQAECDCGYEDAERLLAALAALGEPASGEEGAA